MNIDNEISILEKYRLTPTQLRFLQLLLLLQDNDNEILFGKYLKILKDAGISPRDIVVSLQDRGIILKTYKIEKSGSSFDPYQIPINKNFIKNLYKSSFEMGKELFEVYPQFGSIQGNVIPLRTVAKHFDSLEQAYFKYGKTIGWNPEKHDHIIELTKWAGDNNFINMSLSSYIINNSWLDIEAIKNGDTLNFNPDTIREL